MELTRQRILTLVLAGVLSTVFGLYAFLYRPLILKLRVRFLECQAAESEVATARNNIAILKTSQDAEKLIPPEKVSVAIDELTQQGRAKKVKFLSIIPQKIEKSGRPYEILPIEMETESSYESLGSFLGCLDELERSLVTIRSFDFSPKDKDPSKVKGRLVLHIYLSPREVFQV